MLNTFNNQLLQHSHGPTIAPTEDTWKRTEIQAPEVGDSHHCQQKQYHLH